MIPLGYRWFYAKKYSDQSNRQQENKKILKRLQLYSDALYDHHTLHVSLLPFINYTPSLAQWLSRHNENLEEDSSNPAWLVILLINTTILQWWAKLLMDINLMSCVVQIKLYVYRYLNFDLCAGNDRNFIAISNEIFNSENICSSYA